MNANGESTARNGHGSGSGKAAEQIRVVNTVSAVKHGGVQGAGAPATRGSVNKTPPASPADYEHKGRH